MGRGTADLAVRIGPRRGLIGLAMIAAAIGGTIVLVRYLRARELEDEHAMDESSASGGGNRSARSRKRSRAQHGANSSASY